MRRKIFGANLDLLMTLKQYCVNIFANCKYTVTCSHLPCYLVSIQINISLKFRTTVWKTEPAEWHNVKYGDVCKYYMVAMLSREQFRKVRRWYIKRYHWHLHKQQHKEYIGLIRSVYKYLGAHKIGCQNYHYSGRIIIDMYGNREGDNFVLTYFR